MTTQDSPGQDSAAEVIGHLYEVAVDPLRYEALLDHWEAVIGPRRRAANTPGAPLDGLDQLHGHVDRADQILDRALNDIAIDGPEAILRRIDLAAAFALDRNLHLLACNDAAALRMGLAAGRPLDTLPLAAEGVEDLGRAVSRLIKGNGSDRTAILRAQTGPDGRIGLFHLRLVRPDDAPPYVLVVSSELHWPEGFDDLLRSAFEFTEAETDIVRGLTEGRSLAEVAEARGRSLATLRTQLKSVMAKTETRSQAELVRLTLSTLEMAQFTAEDDARNGSAPISGGGMLEPRPFRTHILADGRRIDYLVLGDPTGRPILFLPENYGFTRWTAQAEAEAARRRIAVVVPVRAGYGRSSPLPRDVDATLLGARDILELLAGLGIDRLPAITLAGDSQLAIAIAAEQPERLTAIIACAGVLPLTRPEQYERMDKWHRFILAGARYTPHLLPFMVKAGFALARRLGKRSFIRAVHSTSPGDVALIDDPDAFAAMETGTEICLSASHSAHIAFAREMIANHRPERADELAAIAGKVPIHVLAGGQDPQTKPETLEEYRADYPWIDFRLYPQAGQLMFFGEWRDALDLATDYLRGLAHMG